MAKRRNEHATCGTCPYRYVDRAGTFLSYCQRHSPVPACPQESDDCGDPKAMWPQVDDIDWCGEHPDFWEEVVDA